VLERLAQAAVDIESVDALIGAIPISPKHLDTVGPLAKDVAGLAKGMALLQEDFEALYEKAKADKPSAATIRIGRLKVPETASTKE
jgi:amidase